MPLLNVICLFCAAWNNIIKDRLFFLGGVTFGLDFSAVLLNKSKNLELCKITAAQGLDQLQSHFIEGLHLVRLSDFIEVSPHNRTSSITPNLKQNFSLLPHTHTSSPSGGEQITQNHHKEKAAGIAGHRRTVTWSSAPMQSNNDEPPYEFL